MKKRQGSPVEHLITGLVNAMPKFTVEFKLGGSACDLTYTTANTESSVCKATKYLQRRLLQLAIDAERGVRLFIAWAKGVKVAHRKGRGILNGSFKSCIWIFLCLAALQHWGPPPPGSGGSTPNAVFRHLVTFFAGFDFSRVAIDLVRGPFLERTAVKFKRFSKDVVLLQDPTLTTPWNLASRITKAKVEEAQEALREAAMQVTSEPFAFWRGQEYNWPPVLRAPTQQEETHLCVTCPS